MSSTASSRSAHAIYGAIKAQKQALRKSMAASLRPLSSDELKEQTKMIHARVMTLQHFKESKSVSCYLSMPSSEAGTSELVDSILDSGKRLFVPKVQSKDDSIMDFLRVYSSEDLACLPAGTWGIKEPADSWEDHERTSILRNKAEAELLDMIILPGVAFDRNLLRLGHGKGYYDRFITAYVASGRPKPLLVGICLREQLLPEGKLVPGESHDWKLDVLVTADEIITRDVATSKELDNVRV
ncbi:5-formyltetrahydrofolate cyclo-ligase [Crepidotus variabilis]|uniref:5-formyltetrahydrofolate cyclo-ligase n=1 Tax=Crepidotus variabilis TaxID=179855 RepID=A0A9P6JQ78_9AGAR|nr:5-formyltetrahydrofolate cyclo-ligase [Crepidotus variabilis]